LKSKISLIIDSRNLSSDLLIIIIYFLLSQSNIAIRVLHKIRISNSAVFLEKKRWKVHEGGGEGVRLSTAHPWRCRNNPLNPFFRETF